MFCFIHTSFDLVYFIVTRYIQRCVVSWTCSSVTSGWPGHSGFPWKKLAIEKGVAIYGAYVMVRQSVQRYGYEFVVAPLRFQFTIKRCMSNDGLESTFRLLGIMSASMKAIEYLNEHHYWSLRQSFSLKDVTLWIKSTYRYSIYIYIFALFGNRWPYIHIYIYIMILFTLECGTLHVKYTELWL